MNITTLQVGTSQGDAGLLTREAQSFVFNYSTRQPERAVSLRMPIRAASYAATELPPIFKMNFPEGWLRQQIESRAARIGVLDDMRLLAMTGEHQIGRLRFSTPDALPQPTSVPMGLNELLTSGRSADLFQYLVGHYLDAGISGAQPKLLVPDHDRAMEQSGKTTLLQPELIVKAAGNGYPHLTQNEFLCMKAAELAGLDVPAFWLSDDEGLFIMQRFDRTPDHALGFEDMAVLLNANYDRGGHYKYQGSYELIAQVLGRISHDPVGDKRRLFESLALSVLTRNGDAHLKNFGVLYQSPEQTQAIRLAPLYDVVTTTIYGQQAGAGIKVMSDRTMALTLRNSRAFPGRDQLLSFAREDCHVSHPEQILERLAQALEDTLASHGKRFPAGLVSPLTRAWRQGLNSLVTGQVALKHDSPEAYRQARLKKAQQNHAYLLSAFWAGSPQLDLLRHAHDLPMDELADSQPQLEAVWDQHHPAHTALTVIVDKDPVLQSLAAKLKQARAGLARWSAPAALNSPPKKPLLESKT